MPVTETAIQAKVRAVLSARDASTRMWRNNVGGAKLADGSYIKYGLGVGSADLIGIFKRIITPEMVGESFGQFVAVEVKTPIGRLSKEQKLWLAVIRDMGGIAEVCRSQGEAEDLLKRLS